MAGAEGEDGVQGESEVEDEEGEDVEGETQEGDSVGLGQRAPSRTEEEDERVSVPSIDVPEMMDEEVSL